MKNLIYQAIIIGMVSSLTKAEYSGSSSISDGYSKSGFDNSYKGGYVGEFTAQLSAGKAIGELHTYTKSQSAPEHGNQYESQYSGGYGQQQQQQAGGASSQYGGFGQNLDFSKFPADVEAHRYNDEKGTLDVGLGGEDSQQQQRPYDHQQHYKGDNAGGQTVQHNNVQYNSYDDTQKASDYKGYEPMLIVPYGGYEEEEQNEQYSGYENPQQSYNHQAYEAPKAPSPSYIPSYEAPKAPSPSYIPSYEQNAPNSAYSSSYESPKAPSPSYIPSYEAPKSPNPQYSSSYESPKVPSSSYSISYEVPKASSPTYSSISYQTPKAVTPTYSSLAYESPKTPSPTYNSVFESSSPTPTPDYSSGHFENTSDYVLIGGKFQKSSAPVSEAPSKSSEIVQKIKGANLKSFHTSMPKDVMTIDHGKGSYSYSSLYRS